MRIRSVTFSVKKIITFALLLYVLSLISVAISPTDGSESLRGYEILLTGWCQTLMGVMGFFSALFQFELGFVFVYTLLALPWLANLSMLLSFLFLYSSQNKQLCKISTISGVICSASFMANPKASIGGTMLIVPVTSNIGAYLWFMSSLMLFFAYYIKTIPNKT